MTETQAPTLDEMGVSGDVEKILADAASTITTPTERWSQESNVVKYGDKKLPERVTVYRRLTGRAVELPTATIGRSLAKKAPDGGPAFVRTQAEALKAPAYIEQVCEVCVSVYGRPKRFYSMANYRGHMRAVHTQEWDEMRETAAEDRQNQQTAALLALAGKGIPNGNQEEFTCEECGKVTKSAFGLQSHQRSHVS